MCNGRVAGKAKPRRAQARSRKNRRQRVAWKPQLPSLSNVRESFGAYVARKRRTLVLSAVAVIAGAAAAGGLIWLGSSARFDVKRVIAPERHWVPESALRSRLGIETPANLFRFDTKSAAARVAESPWVKSAKVRRVFPDGVSVELVENVPAAVALVGELYLIDADGVPFKQATMKEAAALDLLVLTGVTRDELRASNKSTERQLARAIVVAATWASASERPEIVEVNIDPVRGFTLIPKRGAPAIRLGHGDDTEIAKRTALYDRVWRSLSTAEREAARSIHIDTAERPSRVAIAFAQPEKKQHLWAN